ncbi:hypothetical protein [Catenuloplanes atrovinosus]|uniref:Uncharacterized protein n=1 Tax=Catenuloplanes atrovinosus TaxID=137266 RepID=A0AAE3YQX2_9ACTN|nr:hypothetical protein [Catenuloplanes atrovinosus]MDR7277006.1 hypothetical protein [Catenuloplanes atrovinosus]
MDPLTATVLATAIAPLVSGAAGEAGRQAWQSLADRTRAVFRRDAGELPAEPEPAQVPAVAETLAARAADDPGLARWLRQWLEQEARPAAGHVTNVVSGTAGTVIMGRDFSGGITIGRDDAR